MRTELKMKKVVLTSALLLVGLTSRAADNHGAGAVYTMDACNAGSDEISVSSSAKAQECHS